LGGKRLGTTSYHAISFCPMDVGSNPLFVSGVSSLSRGAGTLVLSELGFELSVYPNRVWSSASARSVSGGYRVESRSGQLLRDGLMPVASPNELRKPWGTRAFLETGGRRDAVSVIVHRYGPATGAYLVTVISKIFTGDLQEVLPGELAVRGTRGDRCAVCESCKALVCKVLG